MNLCTNYFSLKTDKNGVALLSLNRSEKRNALNEVFINELIHLLEEINNSTSIHVLMLAAKGDTFCSGVDLFDMHASSQLTQEKNQEKTQQLATLMKTLYQLKKPSIVLVNGPAFGAGVGLIACCDIAIATSNRSIYFCFSEINFHLTPAIISPYIIAAIGQRRAQYYFLSARCFNTEEAQQFSLIHDIVPKNKLHDYAYQIAEQLIEHDPKAVHEIKQLIRQHHPIEDSLVTDCAKRLAERRVSVQAQQALGAFTTNRSLKKVDAHKALIQQLRQQGISNEAVLNIMTKLSRTLFVPKEQQPYAYANKPLAIGHNQTISQPYIVALMTQVLLNKHDKIKKVLEIGTGSGYQAAILGYLADEVYTIERIFKLHQAAKKCFNQLKLHNIYSQYSDGKLGWAEHAPYDGIIVTAAAKELPQTLIEQLAPYGRLVIPLETDHNHQELYLIEKTAEDIQSTKIIDVRFVPLLPDVD